MGSCNDPICHCDKHQRDSISPDEKHRNNNESVMFVSLFVNNDTNMIDYDEVLYECVMNGPI
jgi:hypothetical protein